jgi:hypothetical protein
MSEDTFRWVITAGVGLAFLMTAIMAGAMIGVYRAAKRLEVRANPLFDKANTVVDKARVVMDESSPKIRDMIDRAQEMTLMARTQVQKLDELVTETTERARLQIDRIEVVVDDTVNRVQETTHAVQSTILRPVREVNGVVSGLRAAISTLAHRNRASVDHATQDEEMFI